MSKQMLFLIDVYSNWCDSQNLPKYSADDLLYSANTNSPFDKVRLNLNSIEVLYVEP